MSHAPHTLLRVNSLGELLSEAESRGWQDTFGDASTCAWTASEVDAAEESALDYLVDDLGFTVIYSDNFHARRAA